MRYRVSSGSVSPDAYLEGRLTNVGKGGICFETDRELVVGSQLDIELTAEGFPGPMLARGPVVWCHQSKVTTMFEVGVEFLETSWGTG